MTDASNPTPRESRPAPANAANILAGERTAMALDRTFFASDRTLMATVRTSLSMIGFGFTIYSFFTALSQSTMLEGRLPSHMPALFGLSLTILGVVLLAAAIWADLQFRKNLKQRQATLAANQLIAEETRPRSLAVMAAVLLLLIGLAAILAIALRL